MTSALKVKQPVALLRRLERLIGACLSVLRCYMIICNMRLQAGRTSIPRSKSPGTKFVVLEHLADSILPAMVSLR